MVLRTGAEGFFLLLVSLNAKVRLLELVCCFLNCLELCVANHGLLQVNETHVVKACSQIHVAVAANYLPLGKLAE